jgi:heme exporter protein B
MACERHDDALAGLLAAPVDRAAIFLAKLLANLTLMLALAVVVTPAAITLFRFDLGSGFASFAMVMALGLVGFAAVGTLFAAAVSSTRLQGGLLAMLVFPLCLPLVIVSTQLMRRVFEQGESLFSGGLGGVATLAACTVVYLAAGWIVFEAVLEP